MPTKKMLCLLLALAVLTLAGCGAKSQPEAEPEPEPIVLTLWVYGEGQWGDKAAVNELVTDYIATLGTATDLTVEVKMLDEDDQAALAAAIEARQGPDLLVGTVSQIQHARRCGAETVDLTGCARGVYDAVKDACTDGGALFAAPLAMDVTAMAVNYELLRNVGALQYIDEAHHTWTTEGFISAVKAITAAGQVSSTVALYCGGQNGDQGTRALVTNLYGGSVTNETHDRYVLNEQPTLDALTLLQGLKGVLFDDKIVGSDENVLFAQKQVAMTLCWNSRQEQPEGFTAFPMAYPTDQENAIFPGEVWAVAAFDKGDEAAAEAAKALVQYLTDTEAERCAAMTGRYPVRAGGGEEDIWTAFTAHMAPYEQDAPGWAIARSEWWQLLQRIGDGGDVALETDTFCTNANAAAVFASQKK